MTCLDYLLFHPARSSEVFAAMREHRWCSWCLVLVALAALYATVAIKLYANLAFVAPETIVQFKHAAHVESHAKNIAQMEACVDILFIPLETFINLFFLFALRLQFPSLASSLLGIFGRPHSEWWEVEKRVTWLLVLATLGCVSRAAGQLIGDPPVRECFGVSKMFAIVLQLVAFASLAALVGALELRRYRGTAFLGAVLRATQLLFMIMDGFLEINHNLRVAVDGARWSSYDVMRLWSLAAFFGVRIWAHDFFSDLLHDGSLSYCNGKQPKPELEAAEQRQPLREEGGAALV